MNKENIRLRRSVLAISTNEIDSLSSDRLAGADEAFLDLEDSLAPNEKVSARTQLIDCVRSGYFSDITFSYRINDINSKWWYDDIIEIVSSVGSEIDNIIIPKVESASDIATIINLLSQVEVNSGLKSGKIGITFQIETAAGMTNVLDIGSFDDRVNAIIFGPGDYITSIGGQYIDADHEYPDYYWYYPLSRISHAAASANLMAIDGPYSNTDDIEGFRDACEMSRMLGYDGKVAITSKQIEIANEVFAPSEAEAERARTIVEKYNNSDGYSAAHIDGRLIDGQTYRIAKQILLEAEAAGIL